MLRLSSACTPGQAEMEEQLQTEEREWHKIQRLPFLWKP
jgi:hypothetical protein